MLCSNVALAGDVFEIVISKFKDGISLEQQKKEMASLDEIVRGFEGFKSRDYYFSSENSHWVDFVVWTDIELAKKASAQAMEDPKAGAVFAKIDESSMSFSYYNRFGGVNR